MLFVYSYFSVYDSQQVLLINRIEDSPFASLLVLVWTKKTLQDMQYQTTDNVFNRMKKCPTARVFTAVLCVWKCGETVMGSVYMLDTLHSHADILKLIQH